MSALPTREEIAEILGFDAWHQKHNSSAQIALEQADKILARLRPASLTAEERMERAAKAFDEAFDEAQRAGRIDPLTPSETNRLINTMQFAQVERERDALLEVLLDIRDQLEVIADAVRNNPGVQDALK